MKIVRKYIENRNEAETFVRHCEEKFFRRLKRFTGDIIARDNRFITLAGPTCSGKTTTASIVVRGITDTGSNVRVISIDDFYRSGLRKDTGDAEQLDFDSVKALDTEYFAEFMHGLEKGDRVMMPRYDFKTGTRSGYEPLTAGKNDVFIFEGIQAVYPEVLECFEEEYTSIFISVRDDAIINDSMFRSHEIRLIRRLVRDYLFRNATPEFTLQLWKNVRKNENENIFPNADNPDFIIDSFLPYEDFALSPYGSKLLGMVPPDSDEYGYAMSLKERLDNILNPHFDNDIIPQDSMFREFIGFEKVSL